ACDAVLGVVDLAEEARAVPDLPSFVDGVLPGPVLLLDLDRLLAHLATDSGTARAGIAEPPPPADQPVGRDYT
ncbi:MAG: hypothetical protein ACYDAQ_00990, partial [Mycobacteriales bacterium]